MNESLCKIIGWGKAHPVLVGGIIPGMGVLGYIGTNKRDERGFGFASGSIL